MKVQKLFLIYDRKEKVDYDDCNLEVVVYLDNGAKYIATFFSYKNVASLIKLNAGNGEFLKGRYFYFPHMILVKNCSRKNITEVIQHLLDEGDFESVFFKMTRT